MSIKTGNWVRSYSKGVWQVVREVPEHFAPRFSLREPKNLRDGTVFILKRLVNDKWKPAFETEAAESGLVKPLTKADGAKLERFLRDNEEAFDQFRLFDKSIDFILNLGFSLPRRSDFAKFKRQFQENFAEPLKSGLSGDAILKTIAKSEFASGYDEMPRAATLQFVCEGYEVKRKELIYRQLNVHNF